MKFSMSSVFGGAASMLSKGFVPLLLVTLGLYLLPNILMLVAMQEVLKVPMGTLQAWQGSALPFTGAFSLILYFLTFVHISAVTEIAVTTISNKPVKIGEVLRHGVGNALPLFFIYILCAIGWVLGTVFLIVPAFIFGAIYAVVVPAYVAEKPGVFGAFSRSGALTKGHRWGVFGMWLLILFVFYIITGAVEMPILMPTLKQVMAGAATGATPQPVVPGLSTMVILSVVFSAMWVVLLVLNAGFYAALRGAKETFSGARVEKVFE